MPETDVMPVIGGGVRSVAGLCSIDNFRVHALKNVKNMLSASSPDFLLLLLVAFGGSADFAG
jgi:hypothetical protein